MDVEGWLIFVDMFVYVDEDKFDLLIDMVILMGVVCVVLGFDLLFFFIDEEDLVYELVDLVFEIDDLFWCLLFYVGYESDLKVKIVDFINVFLGGMVGVIMVVFFFKCFVM